MHSLRLLLTILAVAIPGPTLAAVDRPAAPNASDDRAVPRVRPYDARSAALFVEGLRRSDTLRALVDRLEAGNVIVYLQMRPALRGRLAGTLTWVAWTKHFRYVRVSLNPDLPEEALISTIGHELQHAVEVADEPSVINDDSLGAFYRKNGIEMSSRDNGWDTAAAREAGDAVRRDLAYARVTRGTEPTPPFNPLEWHLVYQRAREVTR